MRQCQGFVPTVTLRGKLKYVKFGGGLTTKLEAAYCEPHDFAWDTARRAAKAQRTIFAVPGVVAVCGDCGKPDNECTCS